MRIDEGFPALVGGMVDQVVIQLGIRILPDGDFQAGVRRFTLEPGLDDDAALFPVGNQLLLCFTDPGKQVGMTAEIIPGEDDEFGVRDFDRTRARSQGI